MSGLPRNRGTDVSTVQIQQLSEGVVQVQLARAEKMNALSAELVEDLHQAIDAAHVQNASVLVLRGAGKNLSAGFDFGGYQEMSEGDICLRFIRIQQLLQKLVESPMLTVGLAHGRNFGAGADLFASCQWRVADPGATFRMPGLKFGLVLGTRRLAQLVGTEQALRLQEVSATFSAQHAFEHGFATHIAVADEWTTLITNAAKAAAELSMRARRLMLDTLVTNTAQSDMAVLVQSLTDQPGIKERIKQYLG